jgi:hypothetical protein
MKKWSNGTRLYPTNCDMKRNLYKHLGSKIEIAKTLQGNLPTRSLKRRNTFPIPYTVTVGVALPLFGSYHVPFHVLRENFYKIVVEQSSPPYGIFGVQ